MKQTILIVDDEPGQRQFLNGSLSRDYAVVAAANGREATQLLSRRSFDLVITDERMPEMGGIELIRWISEKSPETPVIVLTAYGSVETAVQAMKLGAQEYLIKPLKSPEELRLAVGKVLKGTALRDQSLLHKQETDAAFPPDVIAESEGIKRVLHMAGQVAGQPTTVFLTGESGTGKEVVARFIHRRSPRADNPFVAINCAAIAETLLESELFGHEKGSFTGATQMRRGRFELAHGGTLFLDEIAEMGVNLQAKLLRVLQEQQFERIGGDRSIVVDVRLIAATNKDLGLAISQKAFREDLYYRLNVFPIPIPPLRDRRADILPLARYFAQKLSNRMGRSVPVISPEAEELMYNYDWPGNVRELSNAIERSLIIAGSQSIQPEDLPMQPEIRPVSSGPQGSLAALEKNAILESLSRHAGDRRASAEELGISLRTLQYRLKEYGLSGRD